MSRALRSLLALCLPAGLLIASATGGEGAIKVRKASPASVRNIKPAAQKSAKKKGRTKKSMPRKDDAASPGAAEKEKAATPAAATPADDSKLKFSRDIAPILVA